MEFIQLSDYIKQVPSNFQWLVRNSCEKFSENIRTLKEDCYLFEEKHGKQSSKEESYFYNFIKYLEANEKVFEFEMHEGFTFNKTICPWEKFQQKTKTLFFVHYNFYYGMWETIWNVQFTQKLLKRISKMSVDKLAWFLTVMNQIQQGLIDPQSEQFQVIYEGPCAYMVFLRCICLNNEALILCTELNRFPMLKDGKVRQYNYKHFIRLIDIVKKDKQEMTVENYIEQIKLDVDKWIDPFKHELQYQDKQVNDFYNCVNFDRDKVCPKRVQIQKISKIESQNIVFDMEKRRWVKNNIGLNDDYDLQDSETTKNILKLLTNQQNTNSLINLIDTIPNFDIKLTDEQKSIIGAAGNIVVLGRSGTGKTACAVLRLLASQVVFKFKEIQLLKKQHELPQDYTFGPQDLSNPSGLHSIIVTASPVLCNEIKAFYQSVKQHLKRKLAQRQQCAIDELEENTKVPHTLSQITDDQFPLFLTIRKLIFMLDATLETPFLKRDQDGQILESGINYDWHEEMEGQTQIDNRFKSLTFAKQAFDYINPEKQLIQQIIGLKVREVTYDIFQKEFWLRKKFRNQQMNPLTVWQEIQIQIKGSTNSYLYPNGLMPLQEYMRFNLSNELLNQNQRRDIYKLACEYENWKLNKNYFDFLDLINYIIRNIKFYGYKGKTIHYLMIDEIQDLSPACILLLVMITQGKLFLAGDTAQAISKVQSFKISGLNQIFNHQGVNQTLPDLLQLTTNFRSNQQVLSMANVIIQSIKTLFPDTLDFVNKEQSMIQGCKPIIIQSNDPYHLAIMLLKSYNIRDENQTYNFGCNQVILVRNQEAKRTLPDIFKYALCLTIFEAKGLQFDDVVLYDFFSSTNAGMWIVFQRIKKSDKVSIANSLKDLESTQLKELVREGSFDSHRNYKLCQELKNLYVAITRAKKRVIIFDQVPDNRTFIQVFWEKMGIVDVVAIEQIENYCNNFESSSSQEEWINLGNIFMNQQLYEQAELCYSRAGGDDLCRKAKALYLARSGNQILWEIQKEVSKNNVTKINLSRLIKQANRVNKWSKQLITKAVQMLQDSANLFISCNLPKEAADCFRICGHYQQAAKMYEDIGETELAAQAYYKSQDFEKALTYFIGCDQYSRIAQTYEKMKDWKSLFNFIVANTNKVEGGDSIVIKSFKNMLNDFEVKKQLTGLVRKDSLENNEESEFSSFEVCQSSDFTLIQSDSESIFTFQSASEHIGQVRQDLNIHQFLAMEESQILDRNCRLIQTRVDILIDDQSLYELINYCGLAFDQLVSQQKSLNKDLRVNKKSLLSFEMDNISRDIIYFILDILEQFECFKLSITICNRYQLQKRIGRLMVCLGQNQSCITKFKVQDIPQLSQNQRQIPRNLIYSKEMDSAFEMVSKDLLKQSLIQDYDVPYDFSQGLILQGYWKKVLFLLDKDSALALCNTFSEFNMYRLLSNYFNVSNDQSEIQINMINLIRGIYQFNSIQPLTLSIQSQFADQQVDISMFQFNYQFQEFLLDNNDLQLTDCILQSIRIIIKAYKDNSENFLQLYDAVTFIIQSIIAFRQNKRMRKTFKLLDYGQMEKLLIALKYLMNTINQYRTGCSWSYSTYYIVEGVFNPFGIRLIKPSKATDIYPYLTHCMVHISSSIFNKIVKDIQLNKDIKQYLSQENEKQFAKLTQAFKSEGIYIADIAAENVLVSLKQVSNKLNSIFANCIQSIIVGRMRKHLKSIFLADEQRVKGACCIGGELLFLNQMYTQFNLKPTGIIDSYQKYCKLQMSYTNQIKVDRINQKLIQIQDNNKQLKELQKSSKYESIKNKIKNLENQLLKLQGFKDQCLFTQLEDLIYREFNPFYNSPPKVTFQAKLYLYELIVQKFQKALLLSDIEAVKELQKAFNLSIIGEYQLFYQEMLRQRYRIVIDKRSNEKVNKVSEIYYYETANCDLLAYINQGNYPQAAITIFKYLDCQFRCLELCQQGKYFIYGMQLLIQCYPQIQQDSPLLFNTLKECLDKALSIFQQIFVQQDNQQQEVNKQDLRLIYMHLFGICLLFPIDYQSEAISIVKNYNIQGYQLKSKYLARLLLLQQSESSQSIQMLQNWQNNKKTLRTLYDKTQIPLFKEMSIKPYEEIVKDSNRKVLKEQQRMCQHITLQRKINLIRKGQKYRNKLYFKSVENNRLTHRLAITKEIGNAAFICYKNEGVLQRIVREVIQFQLTCFNTFYALNINNHQEFLYLFDSLQNQAIFINEVKKFVKGKQKDAKLLQQQLNNNRERLNQFIFKIITKEEDRFRHQVFRQIDNN